MPESALSFESRPVRPEDDYTPLPNRVYTEFVRIFSGPELKIWLAIYRLTAGWWRPNARITQKWLAEYCGLSRNTVIQALEGLRQKRFLYRINIDGRLGYAVHWIEFEEKWEPESSAQNLSTDEDESVLKNCAPDAQNLSTETDFDSSLILKESKTKERPPLSLVDSSLEPPDSNLRIDTWLREEAARHGLAVRLTSGKQRAALEAADSPEFRENCSRLFADPGAAEWWRSGDRWDGKNVTAAILRLAEHGNGPRTRTAGFSAPTPPRNGPTRNLPPATRQDQTKNSAPPTQFAARITALLRPYVADQMQPAPWEWPKIEKIWLRTAGESQKWDDKLVAFAKARPGASLAAVLLAFFDEHGNAREAKKAEAVDGLERVKAAQRAKYGSKGATS